jgi:hypothetical protein
MFRRSHVFPFQATSLAMVPDWGPLQRPVFPAATARRATRWPVGKVKNKAMKQQMADWVQVAVDGYKKLIEDAEDS